MKIGFIAKEYPPHGNLRVATAIFFPELAGALVERGHAVYVITQSHNGVSNKYINADGVHIYEVGPAPKLGSPWRRMLFSFNAAMMMKKLIRQENVDLVDAMVIGAEGFFYSIFKSVPLVLETFAFSDMLVETGTYSSKFERLSWQISVLLEQISLHRADKIIANSPGSYELLTNNKKILPQKISLIWESRRDLHKFKFTNSRMRQRFQISEEAPVLLYIGWLQARKGIHILCESIRTVVSQYHDAVFILKGEDTRTAPGGISFKQYIRDFTIKYDIEKNVQLVELYLSSDELVDLYSACDIFVFPSLSETFGWPVVEAMSCERLVVATNTGIANELKSPGIDIVQPGDSISLSDCIIHFLSLSKENRKELGKQNRLTVMNMFSYDEMVNRYLKAYKEIVNKIIPDKIR